MGKVIWLSTGLQILKVFGFACCPHLRPYKKYKLQFHSDRCVCWGYSSRPRGYKCTHFGSNQIYIARNAILDETAFMFAHNKSSMSTLNLVNNPFLVSYLLFFQAL